MTSLNIAIVGAGLVGRLLAWRLLVHGHKVTLLEATSFDQPRCAAKTAAGMIAPLSEVVSTERLVYQMGMQSLSLWPQWLDSLNARLAAPVRYSANGSVVVAHPQDAAELRQFKQDLDYKLGQNDPSQWLDRTALQQLEPHLAHFPEALYLPEEAHLDNRQLLPALLHEVRRLGGRCIENSPVRIENGDLHCEGHPSIAHPSISKASISKPSISEEGFDRIVDCRGMGSKVDRPDLRGVRGEVMWVETPEVELRHAVRLMHPRYKLYVVPKPERRFIIGATEIESEDTSPISLQSTLELASALYTIHPAFAEARVIETDTNLRPAYRDNLPRLAFEENCISVNGLYRHGFLLAPVLVEHLSQYLSHHTKGEFWQSLVLRQGDIGGALCRT